MSGWMIGLLAVVGYLALQNLASILRYRALVKAISAICDTLGSLAEFPKPDQDKMNSLWEETRTKAAQTATGAGIVLLIILAFLVRLGIHGHL